ncbi:PAS domain-containing protein [Methylonatrum kenyense]|uniref:PAS domain-containing protein n=1 Tax=Methylonatrum kenyense TaxID=455253 RepID=UPI0020BF7B2A|nr:PAS domain-containing protein [Methylonatrum kenyense]MCK8514824.1 PAS domain-containing protein [Methylonatrum kenyense]
MLGYRLADLNPLSFEQFESLVHPDDFLQLREKLDLHLAGGSEYLAHEFRLRTASGDWRWIKTRGQVTARDDDGAPRTMSGVHLDISRVMERREVQELVNQRLDEVLSVTPAVVYACSAEPPHQVVYISPNLGRFFDVDEAQLTADRGWYSLVHPDDLTPTLRR